jgi:hypothetical protein
MGSGPTDIARGVAQSLLDRFGEPARIGVFTDNVSGRGIDIAFFPDCPREGLTTISTIGLCNHDLGAEADGMRAEIIAAFPSDAVDFPNMIAGCAMGVMAEGWRLRRGAIHAEALDGLSRTLAHILFVMPSQWDGAPTPIVAAGQPVRWLMALPIAEAERDYAEHEGVEALENLLAGAGIDMFDLDRPSAATGLGGLATVA